jgi:hypothetical protein
MWGEDIAKRQKDRRVNGEITHNQPLILQKTKGEKSAFNRPFSRWIPDVSITLTQQHSSTKPE